MAKEYQSWADREIKPKRQYRYPGSRGLDPQEMALEEFEKVFTKDAIRSMVRGIKMGGKYLEEVCRIAGVDKEAMPDKKAVGKLFKAVKGIVEMEIEPGCKGACIVSLEEGNGFEARESFSEAVDGCNAKLEVSSKKESKYAHRHGDQEAAVHKLTKDAEEYKQAGDWLQQHANEVQGGSSAGERA